MLGVDLKSLDNPQSYTENTSDPNPTLMRIKPGRLRSVETGRGVSIGDSPERVRELMGAPTWSGGSRFFATEKVWSYRTEVGPKGERTGYRTLIRFRKGKVSQIELSVDSLDGA